MLTLVSVPSDHFILSLSNQVQSSQPEDTAAYYQNSYDTQPYGTGYNMPFTYSVVPQQASKPPGPADGTSAHFGLSVSDLAPVSIDLVKKRLRDR